MTQLSEHLLEAVSDERETMTLSPYIPYALYPTISVQMRLWYQTGDEIYKERADVMVMVLRGFNKRWRIAGESQQFHC